MTPERYQQIGRLYQRALGLETARRRAFLREACAADEALRLAVEELLAADERAQAQDFIAEPAREIAAEMLAQNLPAAGKQIGHYQILSWLGAGGMGEVWLARDTRLERQVALKLLPPSYTQNDERLQRFMREARAASAHNHPNIITIYEIGEAERVHYIAMEYIAGVTLRQRLAGGRLPLPEAISIVKQIAAALETAHEAGIFHRDIKPENVMLRPDGLVKVLDFGLARFAEMREEEPHPLAPPINAHHLHSALHHQQLTASGMVMGTPRYMSPEQARGLKVDERTDVFSLGVVFYEMVTGEPAFAGASTPEIIAALLDKEPPPLRQFVPEAPIGLEQIIRRMLAKEREQRYPGIRALMADLTQSDLTEQPGRDHQVAGSTGWRSTRLKWLVAALALAGVLGFAGYRWKVTHNSALKQTAGEPRFLPLIGEAGRKDYAVISPDETRITFAWDGGKGEEVSPRDIYVKVIGTDEPPLRLTTAPENDAYPCWTPDGKYVTFVRVHAEPNQPNKGDVLRVPAGGGPEQKLAETSAAAAWSPDGRTLAVSGLRGTAEGTGIFLIDMETDRRTRLTNSAPPISDFFPRFSPDGKMVAFLRDFSTNETDLFVVPADGGAPRQLTDEKTKIRGFAWTGDGREIVYAADRRGKRGIWRVSLESGAPERVAVSGQYPINPDISRQGNKLAWTEFSNDANIWLYQGVGFAGRDVPGKFGAPINLRASSLYEDQSPEFSPDGQKIVFSSARTGVLELWMCDADGNNAVRLTTQTGSVGSPRWSDDGQWIAFDVHNGGAGDIYIMSAGGGPWRQLTFEQSAETQPAWSRDGQWIYFKSNRTGSYQIHKLPARGGSSAEAKQITFNGGFEGFESPDGKLFYYTKGRGIYGIYAVPVNGGEEKLVPELKDAGYWRSWTVVNEGICFTVKENDAQWAIRFFSFATRRVTPLLRLTQAPLWWTSGLALSSDGRRLLFAHLERPYDELMLMENFR